MSEDQKMADKSRKPRRSKKQVIVDLIKKSFGEVQNANAEIDQIVPLLAKLEEKSPKKDKKNKKTTPKQFARNKTPDELRNFAKELEKIADEKEATKNKETETTTTKN